MSEFSCPVVQITKLDKHPNADSLSITEVEGNPVVCKTTDFKIGDYAVYIPVDAVVQTMNPRFAFLAKDGKATARIKAVRLRGVFSMGLLIPWNAADLGRDVSSDLGIVKYEEPIRSEGLGAKTPQAKTPQAKAPPINAHIPVYDMENWRKYSKTFFPESNQEVVVTEKIHGTNARFVYIDGKLHVGSHKTWKQSPEQRKKAIAKQTDVEPNLKIDVWWNVAKQYHLEIVLAGYPNLVFFGEVYGDVQDLKYGMKQGQYKLAIFDILSAPRPTLWQKIKSIFGNPLPKSRWLDWDEVRYICNDVGLPVVPELYRGPCDPQKIEAFRSGNTMVPGAGKQIREGVVVKYTHGSPIPQRERPILKIISEEYLLRKNGTEHH